MSRKKHSGTGSAAWRLFFLAFYRFLRLIDPILRVAWRRHLPGMERFVDVHVVGRSSGRERRVLVTELSVGEARYIGHPNGSAAWILNAEAAGKVRLVDPTGFAENYRVIRLWAGPERESVIRATWSQQPFPANLVYRAARRHIEAVGAYFRLVTRDPA